MKEYIAEYETEQIENGTVFYGGSIKRELIRCKDCKYFDPPNVEKDGERHEYNEFPQEAFDLFGIGVTVKYGTNVGGRCTYYNMCGYPEDKRVFVPADNYCGRAEPKENNERS